MRLLPLFLSASLLISVAHAKPVIEQPQRMTGLWLLNTSTDSQRELDYQFCVEQGDENPLHNPLLSFESCDTAQWSGDWMFRNVSMQCHDEKGRYKVEGRFEGDFQYSFQGKITISYDSTQADQTSQTLLYEGRRVAPCKEQTPRKTFFREDKNGLVTLTR